MSVLPSLAELRGLRVTVMGLGQFGGGIGVVRFLAEHGARVTVTDRADAKSLAESLRQIADVPVERYRLGEHVEDDFRHCDLAVASPAVSPTHPLLQLAGESGAHVTTEIGLLWRYQPGRIVAVTGSNGKSTTTAMIAEMLRADGRRVHLGGNLGGSLLSELQQMTPSDWLVLELSSFQLEYLDSQRPQPAAVVVTNFTPNHLDRHHTLDAYRHAKQTLLRYLQPQQFAILNADDADVRHWETAAQKCWFSVHSRLPLHLPDVIFRRGRHFLANALAATTTAQALGVSDETILSALHDFRELPHRLQVVHEAHGITWIDDSAATTPESTIAALNAISRPIALIAGGADKGFDLQSLANAIARNCSRVSLIGQTAPALQKLLQHRTTKGPVQLAENLQDAVAWCLTTPERPLTILLSPACASFGMFRHFVDRGRQFQQLARECSSTNT